MYITNIFTYLYKRKKISNENKTYKVKGKLSLNKNPKFISSNLYKGVQKNCKLFQSTKCAGCFNGRKIPHILLEPY